MSTPTCPTVAQVPQSLGFLLKFNHAKFENCALPCLNSENAPLKAWENVFLDGKNVKALYAVSIIVGVISVIGLLLGIMSYICNANPKTSRNFPERATYFIMICHLAISCTFVASIFNSDKLTCIAFNGLANKFVVQSNNNIGCTITHSIFLFAILSAQIWFLIYAISVYFTSKGHAADSITLHSSKFHFFAWVIPAFITFLSVMFESISADITTNTCFFSTNRPVEFWFFLGVPILITQAASMTLISISACNIQKTQRKESNVPDEKTQNMDKYMTKYFAKTTGFSQFYFQMINLVIIAIINVHFNQKRWNSVWLKQYCDGSSDNTSCTGFDLTTQTQAMASREILAWGIVKIVGLNFAGIACLIWACSKNAASKIASRGSFKESLLKPSKNV